MKRLIYKKVGDIVIDIDLHNGYTIRCMVIYNYKTKKYDATFYIKEATIEKYSLIDSLYNEKISFNGYYKTIRTDILKYVATLHSENYFKAEIENLEYENRCFIIGCDSLEEERINEQKK